MGKIGGDTTNACIIKKDLYDNDILQGKEYYGKVTNHIMVDGYVEDMRYSENLQKTDGTTASFFGGNITDTIWDAAR